MVVEWDKAGGIVFSTVAGLAIRNEAFSVREH